MGGDREYVEQQIQHCQTVFREIEEHLMTNNYLETPSNTWLFGKDFTVADIYFSITLGRMIMVGYGYCLWEDGQMPAVAEYYRRVRQRDSYKKVVFEGGSFSILKIIAGDKLKKALPIIGFVGAVAVAAYF